MRPHHPHFLVGDIEDIDFGRLAEKTVAKCLTTQTQHDGTEKTMTFASKFALNRFIQDEALVTEQ